MEKQNKSKPKVNYGKIFTDGIIKNNPVLVQMVGMCSVLAISSSLTNAVGMGASVTFVLVMSNLVISLLRNFISDEIRIPAFIVVIAGFVTIVQMLIKAYAPEVKISVDASCCAGVSPEKHLAALETMRSCQIEITNA